MPTPDGHEPTLWGGHRKIRHAGPVQPTCETKKKNESGRTDDEKEKEKENDESEKNGDRNDEKTKESESEIVHEEQKYLHPAGDETKKTVKAKEEEKDAR